MGGRESTLNSECARGRVGSMVGESAIADSVFLQSYSTGRVSDTPNIYLKARFAMSLTQVRPVYKLGRAGCFAAGRGAHCRKQCFRFGNEGAFLSSRCPELRFKKLCLDPKSM